MMARNMFCTNVLIIKHVHLSSHASVFSTDHEDKEDEEDVGDEPDRSPGGVGLLDGGEVKVPQNQPELGEEGVLQAAKGPDLHST